MADVLTALRAGMRGVDAIEIEALDGSDVAQTVYWSSRDFLESASGDDPASATFEPRIVPGSVKRRATLGSGERVIGGLSAGVEITFETPDSRQAIQFAGSQSMADFDDWTFEGRPFRHWRGTELGEDGQPMAFADFELVMTGKIKRAQKTREATWKWSAASYVGFNRQEGIVRETYGGWGFGILCDNSNAAGGGGVQQWLASDSTWNRGTYLTTDAKHWHRFVLRPEYGSTPPSITTEDRFYRHRDFYIGWDTSADEFFIRTLDNKNFSAIEKRNGLVNVYVISFDHDTVNNHLDCTVADNWGNVETVRLITSNATAITNFRTHTAEASYYCRTNASAASFAEIFHAAMIEHVWGMGTLSSSEIVRLVNSSNYPYDPGSPDYGDATGTKRVQACYKMGENSGEVTQNLVSDVSGSVVKVPDLDFGRTTGASATLGPFWVDLGEGDDSFYTVDPSGELRLYNTQNSPLVGKTKLMLWGANRGVKLVLSATPGGRRFWSLSRTTGNEHSGDIYRVWHDGELIQGPIPIYSTTTVSVAASPTDPYGGFLFNDPDNTFRPYPVPITPRWIPNATSPSSTREPTQFTAEFDGTPGYDATYICEAIGPKWRTMDVKPTTRQWGSDPEDDDVTFTLDSDETPAKWLFDETSDFPEPERLYQLTSIYPNLDASIVDSYSESNQNLYETIGDGTNSGGGQIFTGKQGELDKMTFYLRSFGSPTGNMAARLYLSDQAGGGLSKPTGDLLAASAPIDVSTLTGSFALVDFQFPEGTTLVRDVEYAALVWYVDGDSSNYIRYGTDTTSPTHSSGNFTQYVDSTGWFSYSIVDTCFYVYRRGTSFEGEMLCEASDNTWDQTTHPSSQGASKVIRIDALVWAMWREADREESAPIGRYVDSHRKFTGSSGVSDFDVGNYIYVGTNWDLATARAELTAVAGTTAAPELTYTLLDGSVDFEASDSIQEWDGAIDGDGSCTAGATSSDWAVDVTTDASFWGTARWDSKIYGAIGFPIGEDRSKEMILGRLLNTCFGWLRDEADGTITLGGWDDEVRTSSATYTSVDIFPGSFRELETLPPVWKATIKYREALHTSSGSFNDNTEPNDRDYLTRKWLDVVAFNHTARQNGDAREIEWELAVWDEEHAQDIGDRIVNYLGKRLRWISIRLNVFGMEIREGDTITIDDSSLGLSSADVLVTSVNGKETEEGVVITGLAEEA